ncbi:MAG: ABC transporter permease, partial [Pyramidobacter sp.]|nr:ABC transporter permease [Pyramidobacter sp.]
MQRYIFKRILMLIPVILGVSLLVYIMMDLAPGNMVDQMAGEMTEEEVAQLYHEYGYDRSVFYRYFQYMKGLLRGDLGYSPVYRQEVWKLYMQRLPATIKLAGASILVCIVLSIPLGIKSATKRGSLTDNTCSVLAILGLSMPNFWL